MITPADSIDITFTTEKGRDKGMDYKKVLEEQIKTLQQAQTCCMETGSLEVVVPIADEIKYITMYSSNLSGHFNCQGQGMTRDKWEKTRGSL